MLRSQFSRVSIGLLGRRTIMTACRPQQPVAAWRAHATRGLNRPVYQIGLRRWYSRLSVDQPAEELKYEDVKQMTQKPNSDVVLVDVREPQEYENGAIPTAVNIPYKSSPGALGLDPDDFYDTFGFAKPSLDQRLVFYCLAGVRSTAAEQLAATYGYQKRGNYTGSYEDWLNHESQKQ
jgi:rhodanese-related sulfurtransferase